MKDLSEKLTVFIISSGNNPNLSVCMHALEKQTCKFKTEIIRDYAPMSKAFQEMLLRVKTPYYIECDEDMVLNSNAIEKMYNDIAGSMHDTLTGMHAYMLLDPHLHIPIYGIKIYKTDIFEKYPYNLTHPSCEMEQLERIEADGYKYRLIKDIVGEHSPKWTEELIFERYYNLMEKFKIYRYVWMEKLPKMLMARIKEDPSGINLAALSGALASIFSDKTIDKEKDSRKMNKYYGRLAGYINKPHQCTLYITSRCNFKCTFCYRQHNTIEQAPDMHPDMVDQIVGKFPSINGYCICGFGEPLLSNNLIPILKKLNAAMKRVGLITNGSLLKQRLPELQGWYQPDYISISLNASNPEDHFIVTGTHTWKEVEAGIKDLVKTSIPAYASAVVTRKTIGKLPELIKYTHSLGIRTLHLHNILPHLDKNLMGDFWSEVLTEEDSEFLDKAKQMPEANIVKKWPVLISRGGGRGSCQFPFYSFAVNGNGSLSFCNSVQPCDAKFGNINDFVVWNSKAAQEYREQFCTRKLPHCAMCFRDWEFDGRKD